MNWVNFLEGGISFMFAFALFSYEPGEVTEEEPEETEEGEDEPREKKRFFPMFCGTCRKSQKHVKVKENVYQCNKCKRTTDLRDI